MPERTKKQLAGGQRRSIHAMSARLRNMAAEWGDVDFVNMNLLDEKADQLDRLADELTENAEAD